MDILTALAILPGLVIIAKVYTMDKIEKEPIGLLLLLLALGAVVCFPVAWVESALAGILNVTVPRGTFYNLIDNFLCVALIEEGGKYLVTRFCTWRNRAFDYRFDAIVYAVAAALGFAMLENCFYVWEGGIQVALMRAVLSVPGHAMFGLFMGISYGIAKVHQKNGNNAAMRAALWRAILIPTLIHGFYDFCLSEGTNLSVGAFYLFMIILYVVAWKNLKKASVTDQAI